MKERLIIFFKKMFGPYGSCYSIQEYSGNAIFGNCGGMYAKSISEERLLESCKKCPFLGIEL